MSAEHLDPESAQEFTPIVIDGHAAEAIYRIAMERGLNPNDVAIGFVAVGNAMWNYLSKGQKTGLIVNRNTHQEFSYRVAAPTNPDLQIFADEEARHFI